MYRPISCQQDGVCVFKHYDIQCGVKRYTHTLTVTQSHTHARVCMCVTVQSLGGRLELWRHLLAEASAQTVSTEALC